MSLRSSWEHRYARGGDSGAGSKGPTAARKAVYVNDLIRREQIASVIDHGCGDGSQLALLEVPDYLGVDISGSAVARCIAAHPDRQFLVLDPASKIRIRYSAELGLSLDVMFHLVEDADFRDYVYRLFGSATRFVCVYATNVDQEARAHVRHRQWTPHIAGRFADWELVDRPEDPAEFGFYLYRHR